MLFNPLFFSLEIGVFVSEDGSPTRGPISWKASPSDVAFRVPYIMALHLKNELVEIHNFLDQKLITIMPFPKQKNFRFLSSYEGCKHILMASSTVVYAIQILEIEKQIRWYLQQNRSAEMLAIIEHLVLNDPPEVAKKVTTKNHFRYLNTCLGLEITIRTLANLFGLF